MADHHLLTVARSLGFDSGSGWWSWDRLLDRAEVAYWQHRPNIRPLCGSHPGYRAHELRDEPACDPCKRAHAMVKAIAKLRRRRGLAPFGGRPALRPCGTHAAYVRHKNRGEPVDLACELAEAKYQRERYANVRGVDVTDLRSRPTSKLSVLTGYTLTTGVSGPSERKDLSA